MQPDSSDLLYLERLYFLYCPVHVEGEYITLKGSHPLEKNLFYEKVLPRRAAGGQLVFITVFFFAKKTVKKTVQKRLS